MTERPFTLQQQTLNAAGSVTNVLAVCDGCSQFADEGRTRSKIKKKKKEHSIFFANFVFSSHLENEINIMS